MGSDLKAIAKEHGMLLALQFGSSVSGKSHARSDVDIAVLLDHSQISFDQVAGLLADLQRLFPEQEVDLVLLNRTDPLLLKKITDDCRLLYGASRRLQELKIYAFKRYQSHKRFFEMERWHAARFVVTVARAI